MYIDQYKSIKSKTKLCESTLVDIFVRIQSSNITTPKIERVGNVFASRTTVGRKYEDIKEFTGLMFVDADKCTDHVTVKNLFKRIRYTRATWYSSSGKNVHALIKIPVCNSVDEYKRRFHSFLDEVKPYFEDLATIDPITKNPTQLAFESYDPNIYVETFPDIYEGIQPKRIITHTAAPVYTEPTNSRELWTIKWVNENITVIQNPGYSQLLPLAKTLGGYASGGYIGVDTARTLLENAVLSNSYFQSSESSGSIETYISGAIGAFEKGLGEPLQWK